MNLLELFVLPTDVVVAPIADLSADLAGQIAHQPGDYYVTRPRTRTVSSIIDPDTARLITFFRTPMTIVDAVLACCSENNLDPRETLESAFDVVAALIDADMLVEAGSRSAAPVEATLTAGTLVDGVEVIEAIHLLGDTEVYRGRANGVNVSLKVAGAAATKQTVAAIRHEADVLAHLDGRISPSLKGEGVFDGRPYVLTTWREGVDLYRAALELRTIGGMVGRDGLLAIGQRVLEAYAHLHDQGVLHGDVHPRNILVGPHGEATVVDYGLAARLDGSRSPLTGGIDLFQAPEVAKARLARQAPPIPSPAMEQYSVGALLYHLLTGRHTHAFSLEPDEMWRQVIEDEPLTFSSHSVIDLPSVELSVRRALNKDPVARYGSIGGMLSDYRLAAEADQTARPRSRASGSPASKAGEVFLEGLISRLHAPGDLFSRGLAAPDASVTYGAAGLGYALLRLARHRNDAELLAEADLWSTRAVLSIPTEGAFWNRELGIVPETFGRASLFHHAAGVHCVEALIAHGRGDDSALMRAVNGFIAAGTNRLHVDVAFGQAGLLIGCAILLDILPSFMDGSPLREFGTDLMAGIWSQLEGERPIAEGIGMRTLGAAHGWSGIMFAALRWCESSDARVPAQLEERLEQLASMGQPTGRSMRWPRKAGEPLDEGLLTASWCNGSAGHTQLWTIAARHWRERGYERLAEMAGWSTFEDSPGAPGNLCCGFAGRAYALLALYRHTGDRLWLARARILGARAAANPGVEDVRINSLYHGEPGIALLTADLKAPEFASMPLFEAEGWP